MASWKRPIAAFVLAAASAGLTPRGMAQVPPRKSIQQNFDGPYLACRTAAALQENKGPLDLGVRIATKDLRLAGAFRQALDFWSRIVDMRWHEVDDDACSIVLLDGGTELFDDGLWARSHLPAWPDFKGRVAFDGRLVPCIPDADLYATAVHEVGHLLGLRHNPQPTSIMYARADEFHPALFIDRDDLAGVAAHHKLRRPLAEMAPTLVLAPVIFVKDTASLAVQGREARFSPRRPLSP